MKFKKPLILISNDDGYQAKGINCLVDMVRDLGDIIVCAPDGPRSGYATAFTAASHLRLWLQKKEEGLQVWSSNGTPVDCVKLALNQFCSDRRPDIIIGGINHGDNASVNAHYSGTMGVALEGCMKYLPSVAFSLCDYDEDADFSPLKPLIRLITKRVLQEGLPKGVCLNVNFPKGGGDGVKVCRMAHGTWYDECVKQHHPRGYDYYWMVGRYRNDEPEEEDTDNWALQHGYVAITPTRIDLTHHEMVKRLRGWDFTTEEQP
ncbi:MAG: 5'/3'-nucleotidase SurE [Prevotella sp.]|nr:5'/3'-nucleotidase SurE [Prevotella sp.]